MQTPLFTAPVSRERSSAQRRNTIAVVRPVGAGVTPSIFGINLCDLLPEPLKTICHIGGGILGTE